MDSINRIMEDGREIEPVYKKKRGIILQRRAGNLIFVSGHGPEDPITDEPLFRGRVGQDLSREEGYQAARECAIIILGALKETLGSLEKIRRFVKVFAMVNCAEGFDDLEYVMDGFSDTVMDVLEERGYHARTVMGTHNLPNNNIACEFEVIVEAED